jgi:hypothetical protein
MLPPLNFKSKFPIAIVICFTSHFGVPFSLKRAMNAFNLVFLTEIVPDPESPIPIF